MRSPERFRQVEKTKELGVEISEEQDVDFGILEKEKVDENRKKLKDLISKFKSTPNKE